MIDSKRNTILNPEDDGIVRILPEPWTQIDGVFKSIRVDDFDVILNVFLPHSKRNGILSYPKESKEGKYLLQKLNSSRNNLEIRILFTDLSDVKVRIQSEIY